MSKPNNFRQFCLSLFINLLIYWNLNAIHALPFLTCSLLYTFYSIIFSSISLSLQISFYTSLSYSSICSNHNIHNYLFFIACKPNNFRQFCLSLFINLLIYWNLNAIHALPFLTCSLLYTFYSIIFSSISLSLQISFYTSLSYSSICSNHNIHNYLFFIACKPNNFRQFCLSLFINLLIYWNLNAIHALPFLTCSLLYTFYSIIFSSISLSLQISFYTSLSYSSICSNHNIHNYLFFIACKPNNFRQFCLSLFINLLIYWNLNAIHALPFLTCSLLYTFYSIIFSSISLSLQISFYTSLSYSSICSNHNIHNYLFFIACKPNNFRQFCLSLFINLLIYWNLNAIHALPFLTCSLLYTFYSIIFSSISLSLQISFYTSLSYSSICSNHNIHNYLFFIGSKPNNFRQFCLSLFINLLIYWNLNAIHALPFLTCSLLYTFYSIIFSSISLSLQISFYTSLSYSSICSNHNIHNYLLDCKPNNFRQFCLSLFINLLIYWNLNAIHALPFLTCSLLYTFYSIIFSSISLSLQISFYTSLSYSSICSNHNIHNYLFFIGSKPNNFRQFCLSLFINLLIYWNLNAIHALPFLTCSLLYTFYSIIFSSISLSLQISFYTSLSYSSICSNHNIHNYLFFVL